MSARNQAKQVATVMLFILAAGCASSGETRSDPLPLQLSRLEADFERLRAEGMTAEFVPVSFSYSAPDRAQAEALNATIANSTPYPAQVREDPARGWLVVGETPLLPTRASEHEKILKTMITLGSNHGCKLEEWKPKAAETRP
jgi:hypothetical protein